MAKDDIFISYSHVDNEPIIASHNGWVDALDNRLSLRLYQLLGQKPQIWRDRLITGNANFRVQLRLKILEVPILVVILSPRYVNSPECLAELRQFCRSNVKTDWGQIDTQSRVFKLIKTPLDDSEPEEPQEPQELQEMLGYRFYEYHPVNGRLREFQHEHKFDNFRKFIERVDDVAQDIKNVIRRLKKIPSGNLIEPPTPAKTVYLAETESILEAERNKIRRELLSQGYYVLPDGDLPRNVTKLEQLVREYLSRSRFSLHLIGGDYASLPEDERAHSNARIQYEMANVRIQYEMAVERSDEDSNFSQVIWMPKGVNWQDEQQTEFIKSVRENTSPQVELVQVTLEDLKSYVISKLKSSPTDPYVKTDAAHEEPLCVYLICHSDDYNATKQLKDFLSDHKFNVIGLARSKNSIKDHTEYLADCHVAMIFQDQANDEWREQKLLDLHKIAGYDQSSKLLARAVYLAGPMTEDKEKCLPVEATVIKERGKLPSKELIQFLEEIRSLARAQGQKTKGVGQ